MQNSSFVPYIGTPFPFSGEELFLEDKSMDKNDKRVNEIIITLNNLIRKPKETRKIEF